MPNKFIFIKSLVVSNPSIFNIPLKIINYFYTAVPLLVSKKLFVHVAIFLLFRLSVKKSLIGQSNRTQALSHDLLLLLLLLLNLNELLVRRSYLHTHWVSAVHIIFIIINIFLFIIPFE